MPAPKREPLPCSAAKSGKHDLVVVERNDGKEGYLAKCRKCKKYIRQPGEAK